MFGKHISILCVVAVGCLATSGSAIAAQFQAESAPVNYVGSGPVATPLVFGTAAGTAQCQTLDLTGTNKFALSTTAELFPKWGAGSCTIFGVLNQSIQANGCSFLMSIGTLISEGTVEILCPPGKVIEILGKSCTVTVGAQKFKGNTMSYANEGSMKTQVFKPTFIVKGMLTYTMGKGCPAAETRSDGNLTGTVKVGGGTQGVWVG